MNPWDEYIEKLDEETGKVRNIHKVHVMYIDGDSKLCDGCDEVKEHVASIRFVSDVWCVCRDCIKDLHGAWDEEDDKPIDMRHRMI